MIACSVVAIDQSKRMVELAQERDVDVRVADVQRLPFGDAEFDAIVAAWMLYREAFPGSRSPCCPKAHLRVRRHESVRHTWASIASCNL